MKDETIDIRWSPAALRRAEGLLAAQPEGSGFRLGLKEAGCAGASYRFDLASGPAPNERRVLSEGIPLFVPEAQRAVLEGTEIDFVKDGLNKVFRFHHPQAREVCGCGESFSLDVAETAADR